MKIFKLLASIVLVMAVGLAGSLFTAPNINSWYATLNKPSFSPPNYLFAPVWTTLFILIGIALYLLWNSKKKEKTVALYLFFAQMVLNFFWSYIFFGQKQIGWALAEIIILLIVIVACIIYFGRISKTAALLFIPYLLWVSFASILNYQVFVLN